MTCEACGHLWTLHEGGGCDWRDGEDFCLCLADPVETNEAGCIRAGEQREATTTGGGDSGAGSPPFAFGPLEELCVAYSGLFARIVRFPR